MSQHSREDRILIQQCELMIDWCADVLDTGLLGTVESSMAKVAVIEALMKIVDNFVQVMGNGYHRAHHRRADASRDPRLSDSWRPDRGAQVASGQEEQARVEALQEAV